mgnify:CR=1 FL=1
MGQTILESFLIIDQQKPSVRKRFLNLLTQNLCKISRSCLTFVTGRITFNIHLSQLNQIIARMLKNLKIVQFKSQLCVFRIIEPMDLRLGYGVTLISTQNAIYGGLGSSLNT